MIKNIRIINFQSHQNSFLKFDSGVNIIVGESDRGKSAIIRALRWLIWNRPTGDDFRSNWGGDTEVTIEINDEVFITRKKTKSFNGYIVKSLGKKDSEFEAIQTDIPGEVIKLLNLNDVNLQQQLDTPFLLSSTPGKVAEYFNKIAHLDQIDNGIRNVQSWIKQIEHRLSTAKTQQTHQIEELVKYDHLEKFEVDVELLEEKEKDLNQKNNALKELKKLLLQLDIVTDEINQESSILKHEKEVNDLLILYEGKRTLKTKLDSLQTILNDLAEISEDAIIEETKLKNNEIRFIKEMGDVCRLCGSKLKQK